MQSANDQNTAAGLVIAGGVLAVAAGFIDWMKFAPAGDTATNFKGTDLTAGTGALGLGILLLIMGIVLYTRGPRTGGKGSSITAIVAGAFILFAGGYTAVAPGDSLAEFESSSVAEAYGISEDVAKAAIKAGIEAKDIEVTALPGAWVGTVAGLLGLIGGIMGLRRSKAIKAAPPPAVAAPSAAPPPAVAPPPTSPDGPSGP